MISRRRAFTLIELLVVISIIALLVSILMPALNSAREQATGAVCLGNQKTLILAYLMYADENEDRVVGSETDYYEPSDPTLYTSTPGRYAWRKIPPKGDDGVTWREVLVEDKMDAIKEGLLWPYINALDVYHCPGDRREFTGQTTFCSYSIVAGLNGYPQGECGWTGDYKSAYKLTQIKRPSSKYVFVEETCPHGVNKGAWYIWLEDQSGVPTWLDTLAIWHSGRGTLAFADGHAEIITWVDESTVEMAELQQPIFPIDPPDECTDLDYMRRGFPHGGLCP